MKRILSLALFLISISVFAQVTDTAKIETTSSATDSSVFSKKPYTKRIFKRSKDRIALDLNGTNWIHNVPGLQTKWYSRGFNLSFYWDFQIKKSFFSIAPGLGVSQTNVYHRSVMTDTSAAGIQFTPIANPDNIKTNKLTMTYIEIPIEFRFRTKPDRLDNQWKFVVGFKAGIRVDGYTKVTTKSPKHTIIEKPYPDLNLWRCGPTVRIGYSSFNLTAYYGVLGIFKNNRGPKVNEFSVGLSFNGL